MSGDDRLHVVILGGGFGGVGCARELAKHDDVRVSLVDRNNYHQFQPLLYQVATSQLAPSDIAYSLRKLFLDDQDVDVVLGEVDSVDLAGHAVTTTEGLRVEGDVLVLAAGSQPNFFRTKGAEEHAFPLYSLDDAVELRSRILGVFEAADNDPALLDQGALNFVDRRRRAHRRGARRRAQRPHPRDDDRGVPPPRRHGRAGAPRGPRHVPARARSPTAPTATRRRCWSARACGCISAWR